MVESTMLKCTNCTSEFFEGVRLEDGIDLCKKCMKEYQKHWEIGPSVDEK